MALVRAFIFAKFPVIFSCPRPGHSISVWSLSFSALFLAQAKAGHKPESRPWLQNQGLNLFYPSILGLPGQMQVSVNFVC